jgi:hypothetical protein
MLRGRFRRLWKSRGRLGHLHRQKFRHNRRHRRRRSMPMTISIRPVLNIDLKGDLMDVSYKAAEGAAHRRDTG